MQTFTKEPWEVRDVDISMEEYFAARPGDDIQSVDSIVVTSEEDPVLLVLGPDGLPDHDLLNTPPTRVKVWLGGGTAGEDYKVTVRIAAESGRKEEVQFKLKVRDQ